MKYVLKYTIDGEYVSKDCDTYVSKMRDAILFDLKEDAESEAGVTERIIEMTDAEYIVKIL
jgi:hypothetical protein